MATNTPGTRTTTRQDDRLTNAETTNTQVGTGVEGVAVYDNDDNTTTTSTTRPSATMTDERAPTGTSSGGSMIGWIIGAIVLIALIYFLLQMIF